MKYDIDEMNYDKDELDDIGYSNVWDDDGNVYGCLYKNDDDSLTFEQFPK